MRAVIQRVQRARVQVDDDTVGAIGSGLLALVGVAGDDEGADAVWLAGKIAELRIFEDADGKFAHSVSNVGGEVLIVSQFTLLADTGKGRRPSFSRAASGALAQQLYERCVAELRSRGLRVETGRFGAHMEVELTNDGPVTIWLDSRER